MAAPAFSRAHHQQALHHTKGRNQKTDSFIEFNGFEPLKDRGRISREEANRLAKERYELFNAGRESDNLAEADAKLVETMKQIDRRILADRARLTPRVTDIPDEES